MHGRLLTPGRAEVGTPGSAQRPSRHRGARRALGLVLLLLAFILSLVASMLIGAKPLAFSDMSAAVTGTGDESTTYVLRDLRGTRTVAGIVVGTALGVAGALIQAFSRNPLADPGILGVNAGASFFVVLGVGYLGVTSATGQVWFALVGALLVTVLVCLIGAAGRGSSDPIRLTLGGVALAAVLTGITTAIMLLDQNTFSAMRSWNAGSLVGKEPELVGVITPFLVVGLIVAGLVARPLNAVALGDELAAGLGAKVTRTRIGAVLAVTLLAGAATALAGPIGFLGLMVPHVARWITGPSQPWIIACSAVIAPTLLLASDVLARVILAPGEVPVGIVTAFVGAPVLIALVRQRRASSL